MCATPKELSVQCKGISTPQKAFEAKFPSLFVMSRDAGEGVIEAYLSLHLAELSKFLNLKNGLTRDHIEFVVEQVMEQYGMWITMADINLIIKRIKSNYYDDMYENFNAQKLLKIFSDYDIERDEMIIEFRKRENDSISSSINTSAHNVGYGIVGGRIVFGEDYFLTEVKKVMLDIKSNGLTQDNNRSLKRTLDDFIRFVGKRGTLSDWLVVLDGEVLPTGEVKVEELRTFVYRKIKSIIENEHGDK